ncbi:MAG: UDP-glucose 4-epimerase, partial [uncultured Thermomicrobiales bacterium]
ERDVPVHTDRAQRADHRGRRAGRHGAAGAPRRRVQPQRPDPAPAGVSQPCRRYRRPGGDPARLRGRPRGRPPRRVRAGRDAVGGHPPQQPDRHLQRLRGGPAGGGRPGRLRVVQPRHRDVRVRGIAGAVRTGRPADLRPHGPDPAGLALRRQQGLRRGDGPLLPRAPWHGGLLPPHRRDARRRRPVQRAGTAGWWRDAGPHAGADPQADAGGVAEPGRRRPAGPELSDGRRHPLGDRLRDLGQPAPVLGHRPCPGRARLRPTGQRASV